ncbi:LPXTG cell wall anchor domain-containing protein, partial [Staphylococcus caprae]
ATGTADDEGNYTVNIPNNVDLTGGEDVSVTSTDEAGNESTPVSITVTDTTAPQTPKVNDITSDDTTITGTTEPHSTVKVTFPDGSTATGTADDEGNYTVNIPNNVDLTGGEDVSVTSTDEAGNESTPVIMIVKDIDSDADADADSGADSAQKHSENDSLPETGGQSISNNPTLFGTILAGLGSLILLGKRRKKDSENK